MATAKRKTKAKPKTLEPNFYQFVYACVFDQPLARRMLQERSSWLTAANSIGETPLAYIVIENYFDAARFLLDAGADVNTRDKAGETPLIQAAGLGYQEIVALLLEHGAEVNTPNEDEETALFKAVRSGHIEICGTLLAAGADIQAQNDLGEHLLDVTLSRKYQQFLSVLIQYGYQEPK